MVVRAIETSGKAFPTERLKSSCIYPRPTESTSRVCGSYMTRYFFTNSSYIYVRQEGAV